MKLRDVHPYERQRCIFLDGVPERARATLLAGAKVWDAGRRSVVYLSGDPADALWYVVGGLVRVVAIAPDGAEVTSHYCRAGQVFGEDMLCAEARTEQAELRRTAATLMRLSGASVRAAVAESPEIALKLSTLALQRAAALRRRLFDILNEPVDVRIVRAMFELGEVGAEGALLEPITQAELAAYVGCTRETISVRLAALEREGLVSSCPKRRLFVSSRAHQLRTMLRPKAA